MDASLRYAPFSMTKAKVSLHAYLLRSFRAFPFVSFRTQRGIHVRCGCFASLSMTVWVIPRTFSCHSERSEESSAWMLHFATLRSA